MKHQFILNKMLSTLTDNKVEYYFGLDSTEVLTLNDKVNTPFRIEFTGKLQCLDCQKIVKKFYGQGLCYVCTMSSPLNSECIVRPELCEAHLGKGRSPEWEAKHHYQPHIVYLANSGGLKVGVTRADQIPTRWIDQGADEAIVLAHTPYRQLAGEIEVLLKNHISDKTNWRAMLKNVRDTSVNLTQAKQYMSEVIQSQSDELANYLNTSDEIYSLTYPTQIIEGSINSIKLDKHPIVEGLLTGIKGQYLIFDTKNALNIRSHSGYEVVVNE